MSVLGDSDLTRLIKLASSGNDDDVAALWSSLYGELRATARTVLRGADRRNVPGETTLVHELYLKCVGTGVPTQWEGRRHFFGSMARAMMQIVVDHRRRARRMKRGGPEAVHLLLQDGDDVVTFDQMADAVERGLPQALERLQAASPQSAEVVWLRYVAGLSVAATAQLMDISARSVHEHWQYARAWLRREMTGN